MASYLTWCFVDRSFPCYWLCKENDILPGSATCALRSTAMAALSRLLELDAALLNVSRSSWWCGGRQKQELWRVSIIALTVGLGVSLGALSWKKGRGGSETWGSPKKLPSKDPIMPASQAF